MKQQEFFEMVDNYGIDLKKLPIIIGKPCGLGGFYGIYHKNGKWIYYEADDKNNIYEKEISSEDEAFNLLTIKMDFSLRKCTNKYVTTKVAKLPKKNVCTFLINEYSLIPNQAYDVWEYLKQNMSVLFEFKYYILTGNFVPDKHCYKVEGYSAEQLYKNTYLEAVGAFNYLVYLYCEPKAALERLKRGLPKKMIF